MFAANYKNNFCTHGFSLHITKIKNVEMLCYSLEYE